MSTVIEPTIGNILNVVNVVTMTTGCVDFRVLQNTRVLGVIVGNGFRNILSFRDFTLYEMIPTDFRFYSCGGGTHLSNETVVMDASLPRGGSLTFCRAMYGKSLSNDFEADQYTIQASFYNVDSWQGGDWGRVGLIYNAKDEANYDFVFLK